jgi:hypothetical protein
VFPSGCHRHPVRLLAGPPPAEISSSSWSRNYLPTCRRCGGSGGRCVCYYLPSSNRDIHNSSVITSSLLLNNSDTSLSKDDSLATWRGNDSLTTWRGNGEQGNAADSLSSSHFQTTTTAQKSSGTINSGSSSMNKSAVRAAASSHLSKLQGMVVGSGSRILRRHTTYIKAPPEETHPVTRHVHSWHKQV